MATPSPTGTDVRSVPATRPAADPGADTAPGGDAEPLRVVVIGGGFGGLAAVRSLTKVARDRPVRVTLVDKRNHHTFQPLLYQVATAGLQAHDVGMSLRSIGGVRRRTRSGEPTTEVRMAEVTAVDATHVHLSDGDALSYDRVIVAAGGITNDLGIPGVAEHAFGLKSLPEATQLRNHILRRFEEASAHPAKRTDGSLTFVIAGGGPTGVELAGALAELVDQVLSDDHPGLDLRDVRIVLLELTDRLLPGFSDRSHRMTVRALEDRGVEVRLETGAEEVSDTEVVLMSGERIPAQTLIWATGIAGVPLGAHLGIEPGRGGRVPVDAHLRALGGDGRPVHDGRVFVIGDLAGEVAGGDPLPQVAPVAIQMGSHVADVIAAQVTGDAVPDRFSYLDKGKMATIGRTSAVVELPFGIRFGGFFAWITWLLLHLLWLAGFKNRVSVLLSWAWNYLTYDHAARLLLDQKEAEEADTSKGKVRRSWADRDRKPPPMGPPEG